MARFARFAACAIALLFLASSVVHADSEAGEEYKGKWQSAVKELQALKDKLVAREAELKKLVSEKDAELKAVLKDKTTHAAAATAAKAALEEQEKQAKAAVEAKAQELEALEQAAKKAKEELAASRRSHDTCQVTVKAVSADLDEHKSLLQEHRSLLEEHKAKLQRVLAAADGYLPLWMSTRLEQGQTWALAKWEELSADGSLKQAKEAAAPYLEQANVYLTQAQQAAAPYVAQAQEAVAKMGLKEALADACAQFDHVEAELTSLLMAQLQSVPALAPYADPVVVQLLVYAVLGSPLLLLLPVLAWVFGSSGSAGDAAGSPKGGKAAGATGRRAAAAPAATKRTTRSSARA